MQIPSAAQVSSQAPLARFLRAGLRVVLPLFGRVEIVGREHLGQGARVFVCNHIGWADPIWIAYAADPTVVHQMAKIELFRWRWFARLITALGAFPIDRAKPSPSAIKFAAGLLRQGDSILIFPTGTRDETRTDARRGAAVIASMGRASVAPVTYCGPRNLSLSHLISRPRITVSFGPAILDNSKSRDRRATLKLTDSIASAIRAPVAGVPN